VFSWFQNHWQAIASTAASIAVGVAVTAAIIATAPVSLPALLVTGAAIAAGGVAGGLTSYYVGHALDARPTDWHEAALEATVSGVIAVATLGLGRVAAPMIARVVSPIVSRSVPEAVAPVAARLLATTASFATAGAVTGAGQQVTTNALTGRPLGENVLAAAGRSALVNGALTLAGESATSALRATRAPSAPEPLPRVEPAPAPVREGLLADTLKDLGRSSEARAQAASGLTEAELRAVLTDDALAARVAQAAGTSVEVARRDASILLSYARPRPAPGTPFSEEDFRLQARAYGHDVERNVSGARIDARSPDEIAQAGGFRPNPNKPSMSLWEHTESGSPGGGNYVSFSTVEGNPGTVTNPYNTFTGRSYLSPTDAEIVQAMDARNISNLRPTREVLYEYRIRGVDAVVRRGGNNVEEAEAIARQVDLGQIESVRPIVVIRRPYMDGTGNVAWTPREAIFGDWRPMPSATPAPSAISNTRGINAALAVGQ